MLLRPIVELVEEGAGLAGSTRRRNGAHDGAAFDGLGEDAEAGAAEDLGDVGDADRVAQIRLVGAVAQHRFLEGNLRERHGGNDAVLGEFLEHAMEHRLDRLEHVFLGHERHFEIELVELARAAVGAAVFVAEAGRDLEVAVEARHHEQLLELLRRLRQGVELARMEARRHQEVAGPFRRGRGQDRRLELGEPLLDHAAAQARDDIGAQHHVAMHLVAAQIEEAVLQTDFFAVIFLAVDLQRQHLGGTLDGVFLDHHLDLARRHARVGGFRRAGDDLAGHRHDALQPGLLNLLEDRVGDIQHTLGQAVMVPEIDEHQIPMVALAMDPAGDPDSLAGILARNWPQVWER